MIRRLFSISCSVIVLIMSGLLTTTIVHAYPPCGSTQNPSAYEMFCRPMYQGYNGLRLRIVGSISSASIRSSPASDAPILATLNAGTYLQISGSDGAWDGQQWWWRVQTDQYVIGWIEQSSIEAAPSARSVFVPCYITLPKIYLVVEGQRRHIVDWQTYVNLGYYSWDAVLCTDAVNYPEGAPITRLVKGSDDPVYLMEYGQRRHIPDMDTFMALGYHLADVTTLPDSMLVLWPMGAPVPTVKVAAIAAATPSSCIGDYSGQIALAFANNTDDTIYIDGVDANCKEFRMWSVVNHTHTSLLTLPAQTRTLRILDANSNKVLSVYTLSEGMNGSIIAIP
jgi:hypothetical protein